MRACSRNSDSGQLLLIAVFILLILVVTIPAVIFLNHMSTRAGTAVMKRQKSVTVADEGVAYVQHVLSVNSATWKNAVKASFPAEFTTAGAPTIYTSGTGGLYAVRLSTGNSATPSGYTAQPYEVRATVQGGVPGSPNNPPAYRGGLQTVLAQKTLAAVLPNDVRASVALELMQPPVLSSGLVVHYGPIVVFSTNTLNVGTGMDTNQFPRKFSQGPITGVAFSRSAGGLLPQDTDKKEYWANSSLGFPNVIDIAAYQTIAQGLTPNNYPYSVKNSSGLYTQGTNWSGLPNGSLVAGSYFSVGTDTAVFDNGFWLASSSHVVYVNGNAEFDNVNLDLKNGGAFIITGNLTLKNHGTGGLKLLLKVPPTAVADYPFTPTHPANWPCSGQIGSTCCSAITGLGNGDTNGLGTGGGTGLVHYRGFIYVQGNVIVANTGWLVAGAMRIDGTLNATNLTTPTLTLVYDDEINHSILVSPLELMIDNQKEVAP